MAASPLLAPEPHSTDARFIMDWPDELIGTLKQRLAAVRSGSPATDDDRAELEVRGLVKPATGELTDLGQRLALLVMREDWQEGDELQEILGKGGVVPAGAILEVGCSMGRVLRQTRYPAVTRRVGIDVDTVALALGQRLARHEGQDVQYLCASAHALPYPPQSFDLVICRNALTYMHQRRAVREMCRVLKPGGHLLIRYENFFYDLGEFWPPKSIASVIWALRDLGYGLVHALSGWQPQPGGLVRGRRAFATLGRLRRMLSQGQCGIVLVEASKSCPEFAGRPNQTSLLARKMS